MPLVLISYDPTEFMPLEFDKIPRAVAEATAKAMSTAGALGKLTANDVNVHVRERHKYDWNPLPLDITIFVQENYELLADVEERKDQIIAIIGQSIPKAIRGKCSIQIIMARGTGAYF